MNRQTRIFLNGWIIILITGFRLPTYLKRLMWGEPSLIEWVVGLVLFAGFCYGFYSVEKANAKPKEELPEACRCKCGNTARAVAEFGRCGKCMESTL